LKEAVKFNLRYSPNTLWEKLKKNHENPQLEQPVPKSKFGSRFSQIDTGFVTNQQQILSLSLIILSIDAT